MPPINVQINRALAAAVRRSMVLPSSTFPPAPPLPEDTSEETIRNFQVAGALPATRDAAQDDLTARRAAARRALGEDRLTTIYTIGNIGGYTGSVNSLAGVGPPAPFEYSIIAVILAVADNAAAGAFDLTFWNAIIARTNTQTIEVLRSGDRLIPDTISVVDGIPMASVGSQGQEILNYSFDVRSQVFEAGTFIHFTRNVNANVSINPTFIVQTGIPLAQPTARFLPPLGRLTFNLNTAPPAPRQAAPKTPRAARLNVTQGGRIINQRVVAWTSLDPDIKRDWFNFQIGGAHDPNIEWIA